MWMSEKHCEYEKMTNIRNVNMELKGWVNRELSVQKMQYTLVRKGFEV